MLTIDGAQGEGGGQVLRTSLALSIVTGTPFVLENVRANRAKPGLMRQHLTCVLAAARVGGAYTEGATLRSSRLQFEPSGLHGGHYRFDIGSAGSTTLVLQSVLPALLLADQPSVVELGGGTHNPMAPPLPFLDKSFLRVLERMGATVEVELDRIGFAPAGGGRWTARITPPEGGLKRLDWIRRGEVTSMRAEALVANLPKHIGHRELKRLRDAFDLGRDALHMHEVDAFGPGNMVYLEATTDRGTVVFSAFGQKRRPAEKVAGDVVRWTKRWLQADVPVDEHLADQLLIPMALAGGGRFRTTEPSLHTRTNADIVRMFLPVDIRFVDEGEGAWMVAIEAT